MLKLTLIFYILSYRTENYSFLSPSEAVRIKRDLYADFMTNYPFVSTKTDRLYISFKKSFIYEFQGEGLHFQFLADSRNYERAYKNRQSEYREEYKARGDPTAVVDRDTPSDQTAKGLARRPETAPPEVSAKELSEWFTRTPEKPNARIADPQEIRISYRQLLDSFSNDIGYITDHKQIFVRRGIDQQERRSAGHRDRRRVGETTPSDGPLTPACL